jgi:uncharacterized membrane protein
VIGVFGVLVKLPDILWAFFFGFFIASAIGKQVEGWSAREIITIIFGIIVAYLGLQWLSSPAAPEGNHALWFVFLSAMMAIFSCDIARDFWKF